MVKLRFTVNPRYLLAHSLERAWGNKPSSQWVKLAQKIKSSSLFILKDMEEVFRAAVKTREFKKILEETERYRTWVEKEWKKNREQSTRLLENITGIKLPNITVTVIVTHPKLTNGTHIPKEKIILWGHPEEWKNYTVVYLCHELLHILTHGKYSNEEAMHAIIELATDNELRVRLNKGGAYFSENDLKIGHQALRKLEKKLLPLWRQYARGILGVKDIFEFERKAIRKFKIKAPNL